MATSQNGIVKETSYIPYNANSAGACISGLEKDERSAVEQTVQFTRGDEAAMKCHIANVGPIAVSLFFDGTSLETYQSGIWDDPENKCSGLIPTNTNHAVYLVGYGSEIGRKGQMEDYWLLQNSWGTNYGVRGFFKIKRGVNLCNIANKARYPLLKTGLFVSSSTSMYNIKSYHI